MNGMISCGFEGNPLRVIMRDGEPWFVMQDVCNMLRIGNPAMAAMKLDSDERGTDLIDTAGGPQRVIVVNESGLYTVMLRCRKSTQTGTLEHRFRRWVTSEVLPSIRKGGRYKRSSNKPPEPDYGGADCEDGGVCVVTQGGKFLPERTKILRVYAMSFLGYPVKIGVSSNLRLRFSTTCTNRAQFGLSNDIEAVAFSEPCFNARENEQALLDGFSASRVGGEHVDEIFDVVLAAMRDMPYRTKPSLEDQARSDRNRAGIAQVMAFMCNPTEIAQ